MIKINNYINKIHNISIDYPDNWSLIENINNMIFVLYEEKSLYMSSINLMRFPNIQDFSIQRIIHKTKLEVQSLLKDFSLKSMDVVNDTQGILSYSGKKDKNKFIFNQCIFKVNRFSYSFTSCCEFSLYDKYKDKIEEILASIKILTPNTL